MFTSEIIRYKNEKIQNFNEEKKDWKKNPLIWAGYINHVLKLVVVFIVLTYNIN